ncbi:hypothetical protein BDW68DRAFT_192586 [Aspergillus falconensis]
MSVNCRYVQGQHIKEAYVALPIVLHLAKNQVVDSYDLKSLRMLTSGFEKKRGVSVRQAYGLSETTWVSHIQLRSFWQSAVGSNGPVLPGLTSKFVRPGESAATVEEGELWVRGPTVFNEYRDEPDMTAESLTQDGWSKTGDIGYEDSQGNLYITDRSKDMIKFKGYQVAPAELEDLLLKHPAVKDAAVIGLMNADLQSEVPLGYVTLNQDCTEDDKMAMELLDHVKNRVIHYKRVRGGITWTPQISESPSGRILKRVLRDRPDEVDRDRRIGATNYAQYRSAKL